MTAILSALLGASAAGFITHILAIRRERQKEEKERQRATELERRERIGLLKLVHVEVTNNLEHLEKMGSDRDEDIAKAHALRSQAWELSMNRLAELVENKELLEYLVTCYGALYVFKDRLTLEQSDYLDPKQRAEYSSQVRSVAMHHRNASKVCGEETETYRYWHDGMLKSGPDKFEW
jgi:hypothetical protein